MDAGEVGRAADASFLQMRHQHVARVWGVLIGQANHIDKPAPRCLGGGDGQHQVLLQRSQRGVIPRGHLRAAFEQLRQAFELGASERSGQLVQTIVIAQADVLHAAVFGAALVA